jgi:hypothetical protein
VTRNPAAFGFDRQAAIAQYFDQRPLCPNAEQ